MEYLNNLANTLSTQFGSAVPGLIGAILAIIIGYIVANILKKITKTLMGRTTIDERIGNKLDSGIRIDDFVAKLVYYIVLIYALLISLNLLGVSSVLAPLEGMMQKFLEFLPNGIAAGIIGYAGYIIAKVVSEATGFLSTRAEAFTTKNGIDLGSMNVSKIIKQLVFIFIFIPILIVALDTLKMTAISGPAKEMLQSFMSAIPNIIAAFILLGVFYIVGKYLIGIGTGLLQSMGVDDYANKMGLAKMSSGGSFSKTLGKIGLFFIMFLAVIGAVDKLGLTQISGILDNLLGMSGKIFFGMIVVLAGYFVSNMAVKAVGSSDSKWLVPVVRFATMGIFLAFGLSTMGIATGVVNMAFGLTLGAVAVAFALSFGLGGREAAGKQMEQFFDKINKK